MDHDTPLPELLPVDVTPELQDMLDRFPLPQGVMDADCNQEEIAASLRTTVNTVAKWIKQDGLPVAQQGGNGRAYVLRLSHCWAWKLARDADMQARTDHNRTQVAALQASFLGLDVEDPHAQMTAQQRRDAANADIAWSRAAHLRRQLVPLSEVVDLLESLNKHFRDGIEAMPDRLERELGLRPEQVQSVVRIGADILNLVHEKIEEAELTEQDVPEVEVQRQWMI